MTDAAAVLGAIGALGVLLGRTRITVVAGLAAVAGAETLLANDLLPGGLDSLVSVARVAAFVFGVLVLVALGGVIVRYPAAVTPAVVALAPFRLPFDVGTDKRFFVGLGEAGALGRLIPLYVVLAAAAGALAWRALRGEGGRPLPPVVAAPAALLVALMSVSLLWARDAPAAANRLAFFILPFAILLAVVARAPLRPWLPRVLAIEAVGLACLFALVGIAEAWTHRLLFYEPKLAVANSYTSFFRVTSFFSDPSIYARHLVLALVILVVALLLGRVAGLIGAALMAVIWTGLFFSYSQSAMAALVAATVLVTAVAGGRRMRRLIAIASVAVLVLGSAAFVTLVRDHSADRLLSGRWTLVRDTWVVVENHPLAGVGLASQPAASREETAGPRSERRKTSHTAPLTVAAELGVAGILLYVAFLAGAAWLFWALRRQDEALGLALLGVLAVLFVHSLSYGVFFEDPLLWAAVGVGAGAALGREQLAGFPSFLPSRAGSAAAPAAR